VFSGNAGFKDGNSGWELSANPRAFLTPDNTSISGNQCSSAPGNPANCLYIVDGQPLPHADGTPVCGQTDAKSNTVTVTPGNSFSTGPLAFTFYS